MPVTLAAGDVPTTAQGFDALAELLTKEFNALIPGNKRPGNNKTNNNNNINTNNNVSHSNAKTNTAAAAPDKTPKKGPSIRGTISFAHKQLSKTSLFASIAGKRKSPSQSITAQPNTNEPQTSPPTAAAFTPASSTNSATTTRSMRSTSSRNSVPTPISTAMPKHELVPFSFLEYPRCRICHAFSPSMI